jgi:hypothetical protein
MLDLLSINASQNKLQEAVPCDIIKWHLKKVASHSLSLVACTYT